ncbi:MAG: dihydropteroate synthase [Bacteriovoracales bacterium]|nr:dihydropteroate synthase [Bacteriovoracales bacterium]
MSPRIHLQKILPEPGRESGSSFHLSMGIINITPDSFFDGGCWNDREGLAARVDELRAMDILDIGAESTAPKSLPIGTHLEYARFQDLGVANDPWDSRPLSIDTYHLETFRMLQDRFAPRPLILNDIGGHLDRRLADLLRRTPRCPYIFCHNLAPTREESSRHMDFPYRGTKGELSDHLANYFFKAYAFWERHGLQNPLIFDPGFGFSKTYEYNWHLLDVFEKFVERFPRRQSWLIGLSKKSFLQRKALETGEDIGGLHRGLIARLRRNLPRHTLIFRLHDPKDWVDDRALS